MQLIYGHIFYRLIAHAFIYLLVIFFYYSPITERNVLCKIYEIKLLLFVNFIIMLKKSNINTIDINKLNRGKAKPNE